MNHSGMHVTSRLFIWRDLWSSLLYLLLTVVM